MRTVRDESGKRYLLLKESADASRVHDPETGEERYLDNADLEPVEGESPLSAAAAGVPESVRRLVLAVRDERSLDLLIALVDRGPVSVLELLDASEFCESDLHGLLAEFRAAGLIEETEVGGRRGYVATRTAETAVERLRG